MVRTRIACLAAAVALVLALGAYASALEVQSGEVYCFSQEDFAGEELRGVCITGLPGAETGTLLLGSRVIRAGDILTAEQLAQMTFAPLETGSDAQAVVKYLPIYESRVDPAAEMTISIKGRQDKAPVAEDSAMETYKNLSNDGSLKVTDPEGKALVYTVTRQPRRGNLEVRADGTFTYTPKKNKVGVDSFTFTATDPAGNVSREATVTVQILKTTDKTQYSDTTGASCRFAAEWMKNTGLFVGEQVGGRLCFNADRTVSKGEFLAMVVKSLEIPVDDQATYTGYADEIPAWLRPYLAAAMRSGLTAGLPMEDGGYLKVRQTITGAEAAVVLQNAMDLAVPTGITATEDVPTWAATSLAALNDHGFTLSAGEKLTRGQVAETLYKVSTMADSAPGLKMYQ